MLRAISFAALVFAAGGCCPIDLFNKTPGPPATAGSAPAAAKAGHASGHVLGPDGKPLALPGAKARVRVDGVSARGENVGFSPAVDEHGGWDVALPPGNFAARATLEYDWKGKRYEYPLHPLQDNTVTRAADAGFVQDFQWRIQGVRAGLTEDPKDHTHWYGSTLAFQFHFYRNDVKKSVIQPGPGTKAVFTIAPTGPLIDGTEAKALVFEREYDKLLPGLTNTHCCDIPVGTYRVTGVEVSPEGVRTPLLIQRAFAEFGDSLDVTIEPGEYGFASSRIVGFTRRLD